MLLTNIYHKPETQTVKRGITNNNKQMKKLTKPEPTDENSANNETGLTVIQNSNETSDDPTIKSVCRIAAANGYGGVYMMNCWAYVSTQPEGIKRNPMSDEWNNNSLTIVARNCSEVVFAWGNFKIVTETGRAKELIEMFPNAKALKINQNGSPKHPLYCKSDTKFIPFK